MPPFSQTRDLPVLVPATTTNNQHATCLPSTAPKLATFKEDQELFSTSKEHIHTSACHHCERHRTSQHHEHMPAPRTSSQHSHHLHHSQHRQHWRRGNKIEPSDSTLCHHSAKLAIYQYLYQPPRRKSTCHLPSINSTKTCHFQRRSRTI